MEQPLFDIYLTGRLTSGLTAADATQRLAQLFRTSAETAANLITGKPQLIKRSVDHATALKYRDALQRSGLEIDIREQMREQLEVAVSSTATAATPVDNTGLTLAPAGADLLRPDEHRPVVTAHIDTGHISLAPQLFTPFVPAAATARSATENIIAPDLTLAPPGGELLQPDEKSSPPAITPEIPDLTLAAPGALLETLVLEVAVVTPDISGLSLAPPGGELLNPTEFPEKPVPSVPDISHLRLSE
ncbi:MAG: hypothetical protein ABW049_05595 [Spongiibacteraceae bacterium]